VQMPIERPGQESQSSLRPAGKAVESCFEEG